ncbi:hypothetical protein EKO27_g1278 [Xylaria grammica]|uniref:Zn(2)-C6 fungal-type domain-containing protein n=1 Tax=Xylaria grammica TaxID=363999 RepID=A0A439DHI6_9PEZI|nr:hypothetical protein EKO27_g1278 [Xylaria grammica]
MASVVSASPSRQDFLRANSTEDSDSWQHVETNSSPAGYIPSPGSSFNGWGIVGYPNQLGTSPSIMSPLPPPTSHPNQQSISNIAAEDPGDQFLSFLDSQQFVANHEIVFSDLLDRAMNTYQFPQGAREDGVCNMPSFEGMGMQARPADLDIPIQFQHDNNVAPWAPMRNLPDSEFMFFDMEGVSAQMSRTPSHGSAATSSYRSSSSMPSVKAMNAKDIDPIKKVRGGSRVEKKKPAPLDNFVVVTPTTINQLSGKPNPFECFEVAGGIQRGRKGPLANKAAESARNIRRMGACFCCRSRKVKCDEERPCKNCKKISAQIPQVVCWQFSDFLPVLFPDFIRGHFKKEVMARFVSDNVAKFYSPPSTSAEPWLIELSSGPRFRSTLTIPASFCDPKSAEVLHHWHVSTGTQLDLHLRPAVPIGIDPKDSNQREALKRRTREYIHNLVSEPWYAEQVTDSLRSTQLPRQVLTIVQRFAQRSQSAMVKRALAIYVAHYVLTRQLCLTANAADRLHHLQQTQPRKVPFLSPNIGAQTTTRILNRQIKAVLDEYLLKETQSLFATFGSALKPRSRAEWASCLASFLVLCLLFEGIEAAADTFAVSEVEVALRTRRRSTTFDVENKSGGFTAGGRKQALDVCREINNLPFRQVAYRFHAVYQTHHVREPGIGPPATGSSASSGGGTCSNAEPTFNPLVDPRLDLELEPAAAEMAASLRALLDIDGSWHELDYLAADPILSQAEAHPYPRDITLDYTGRLLARFLLSFTDEKYLFDGQY